MANTPDWRAHDGLCYDFNYDYSAYCDGEVRMSEAVLVAVITGGLSLIGVIITVISTSRRSDARQREANAQMIAELKSRSDASDAKLDKEVALLRAEVDELMREVRQHNNFAQRIPVLEEQIKVANHRIEDLEKG